MERKLFRNEGDGNKPYDILLKISKLIISIILYLRLDCSDTTYEKPKIYSQTGFYLKWFLGTLHHLPAIGLHSR